MIAFFVSAIAMKPDCCDRLRAHRKAKVQHWRHFWQENGLGAAPMLEFHCWKIRIMTLDLHGKISRAPGHF